MKFIIDNWMLLAIALTSGALLLLPIIQGTVSAGIDPANVVLLMNREKAVVIDVCEPSEYAAGHISSAKNIPLSDLESKLPNAVKYKKLPVVLVCQSGMRSNRAVAVAKKLGYERAYSLGGGLSSWRSASLPIEKS